MALPDNRPVSQLFGSIVDNIQDIIRSEMRLAKAEIREELPGAVKSFVVLAVGILIALYAFGFALLAAMYGLARVVEPWLAALIVAGVVGVVALALVMSGRARLKKVRTPTKTIDSVKENMQWAKHPLR